LKLMEECAEVAQRASKQIQFGKEEVQAANPFNKREVTAEMQMTNAERLRAELTDLNCIAFLLEEAGELPHISLDSFEAALVAKKQKLDKYLGLSRNLGRL
jgi:NTP pyrophosphatase (non-canonical NTP hydrolase)